MLFFDRNSAGLQHPTQLKATYSFPWDPDTCLRKKILFASLENRNNLLRESRWVKFVQIISFRRYARRYSVLCFPEKKTCNLFSERKNTPPFG